MIIKQILESKYVKIIFIFIVYFILFGSGFFGGCLYSSGSIAENDKRHKDAYEFLKREFESEQRRNNAYTKLFGELNELRREYNELQNKIGEIGIGVGDVATGLGSEGSEIRENNRIIKSELEGILGRFIIENGRIGDIENNISELEKYLQ